MKCYLLFFLLLFDFFLDKTGVQQSLGKERKYLDTTFRITIVGQDAWESGNTMIERDTRNTRTETVISCSRKVHQVAYEVTGRSNNHQNQENLILVHDLDDKNQTDRIEKKRKSNKSEPFPTPRRMELIQITTIL